MTLHKTDLISAIHKEQNFDAALKNFEDIIKANGFQYYMFTQMGTLDSPSVFRVKQFKTTFPDQWMDVYMGGKYFYNDPIAKHLLKNDAPFFWSEYLQTAEVDDQAASIMQQAISHGMCDGIGCSYLKNKGYFFTLSVSTNQPFQSYDQNLLSIIYLAGANLVSKYAEKYYDDDSYEDLSNREIEIVSIAAMGKTDQEIAMIAGISINTVRYHWKNIFTKMRSYSRVFAIIRALNLGYIDPYIFEVTTESGSTEIYKKHV